MFAATGDAAADRSIVAAARAAKIPANAVDQPDYCDFFTPALVNRAPVAVAIGTEGAGPVLAQMIRAQIDQLLSPSLGKLAELAIGYRKAAEQLVPARCRAPRFLAPLLFRRCCRCRRATAICRRLGVPPMACLHPRSASKATSGWSAPVQAPRIC